VLDGDVIAQFERDVLEGIVRAAAPSLNDYEDIFAQGIPKERLNAGAGHYDRLSE
jgi:hypothetical protein